MSGVTINKDAIYAALKTEFDTGEFQELFARLKELKNLGVDPFRNKSDGTPQGWANLQEANAIVNDILRNGLTVAEKVCADVGAVGMGKEKCAALAKWLDDVIALPIWLEPFDEMLFKFVISQAVSLLNRIFGKDWINHIPMPQGA